MNKSDLSSLAFKDGSLDYREVKMETQRPDIRPSGGPVLGWLDTILGCLGFILKVLGPLNSFSKRLM